jgi:hypothetical protein
MSEWIKCIDALPHQGQTVIAFSKTIGVSVAQYWSHEPGVHDGDTSFCTELGDELFPVTHWQSLPDHPNE